jgi:O-antigen/teichoic acid export membrane protein
MAIRPKIKSFGYATILYGFSNLLTKIVAVTLIPIYTNYLSVYEVGIIALLEMIELFVVTLIPIGCVNAMWRYLPDKTGQEKNRIIISSFTLIMISGIIIVGLLFLFKDYLSAALNINSNENLIIFVFLSCFLRASSNFIYWLLQYKNQAFLYLMLSLAQFISLILLTIYFIVGHQTGVVGIYFAKVIVFSGLFIFTIVILIRTAPAIPSARFMKKLLSYGLPIIPLILLMPVLTVSDRYFLKLFSSVEDIGRYGIAYKFGMLINMLLVVPIQRSWGPQMFQVGNVLEENKRIHQDITFYYAFIGLFILVGLSLFSDTILTIFSNDNYLTVSWVIPWISLAYFIGGFKIFLQASASIADRTDLFIKTGIYTIISNIVLNYILIKNFGIQGAVASTILSYLILVVLLFFNSKSVNKIKWPIKKIFHGAFIALFLIITFESIKKINLDYEIIIKVLILILFPIISILTKLIGNKEINGLRFLWDTIFKKL